MVNTVVNSNFQALIDFFDDTPASGEFIDMFSLTFAEELGNLFNVMQNEDVTPTALSSTLISAEVGTGLDYYSIELHGTGFGPISGIDLEAQFNNLVEAFRDGSATAAITQIVLKDDTGTPILTIDTTATSWTITSGTDVLTFTGNMPTSLTQIWDGLDEVLLTDGSGYYTGDFNPSFDPLTSVFAAYDMSSITAASGGTTQASITFGASSITVDLGDFEMVLTGNLPDNLAELLDVAINAENETPSGYTVTSITITDTITTQVVMQQTGTRDLVNLFEDGLFGSSGNDTFTSTFVGSGPDQGFGDLGMGAGDDVAITADYGGNDDAEVVVGDAGHDEFYLGAGDFDIVDIFYENYSGPTTPYTIDVVGNDLVFTLSATQSVTLIDQMISSNVERMETYDGNINLQLQEGTTGDDIADFSGNDWFTGGVFYDGGAGYDVIIGSAYSDIMLGGADEDFFVMSPGGDSNFVDGGTTGEDFDGMSYAANGGPVIVDFGMRTVVSVGDDHVDNFVNIEFVRGSNFDDEFIGGMDFNRFQGIGGADTYDGSAGSYDEVDYRKDTNYGGTFGVVVNLDTIDYSSPLGSVGAESAYDGFGNLETLIDIERVRGSAYDDVIIGSDEDNRLRGEGGEDLIFGGDGNDRIEGGSGADMLYGGDGRDRAEYYSSSAGVTVVLETGIGTGGHAEGDMLFDIEKLVGSDHVDALVGSYGEDNVLRGGAGGDYLHGLTGNNTVSYWGSDAAVTVRLYNSTATGGDATGDTLYGFSNATGSDHADVLIGAYGVDNILEGGAGGDYLNGLTGDNTVSYRYSDSAVTVRLYNSTATGGDATGDTLVGFSSAIGSENADVLIGAYGVDNTLEGGAGADYINGLTGSNTASYARSSESVIVRLYNGTGVGGDAEGDTLVDMDNAIGSNNGDVLIGAYGVDNELSGGKGGDYLFGLSGADTLRGGRGDDLLDGGSGADMLFGDAGEDTVTYASATGSVTVRFYNGTGSGSDANGDSYDSIENAVGSAQADALIGAYGVDNILEGGAGADYINGLTGNNTASYESSAIGITARLYNGTGVGGDAQGDTLVDIQNLIGSASADALIGAYGVDNILEGGAGADYINGLSGSNTASYQGSTDGVTVRLYNGTGTGGDAEGDTLVDIDNVMGSDSNDLLLGSYGVGNIINGGAGGDHMFGLSGADTFAFNDDFGKDVIHDFEDGTEFMDMTDSSYTVADLRFEVSGSDTIVHFDMQDFTNEDTITITGITAGIDAGDFLF